MSAPPDSAYLTTAEVAAVLACSPDTVLRAIARGDLTAVRYGRMVRVERAGLEEFLAAHAVQGDRLGAQRRRRRSAPSARASTHGAAPSPAANVPR